MQFEIYTEIDHADHSNWTDKHISSDGKVYYMGSRAYLPFVKQAICHLNEAQKASFLASELVFLPYFRLIKDNLKVADFLNAADKKLFYPENLEGYLAYDKDDRTYFNTIIEPRVQYPHQLVLLRENSKVIYVEAVFYRSNWADIIQNITPVINDKYKEGEILSFIEKNEELREFLPII